MKVLISTPIFGDDIKMKYHMSFIQTMVYFIRNRIEFDVMHEARNLIHQARNRSAHYAIKHGFDKLLFIDSDISWKVADIHNLVNAKHKIVGGVYPFKSFPIRYNFSPMQGVYKEDSFNVQGYIDAYKDENDEVEVHRIPTGFLMIDVSIFKDLEPVVETYHHIDPMTRQKEHEKMFFPFAISADGFLNTEDWSFCDLVQKVGHKVYWHTRVIVDHVGSHTYSGLVPVDKSYNKLNVGEIEQSSPPVEYVPPSDDDEIKRMMEEINL